MCYLSERVCSSLCLFSHVCSFLVKQTTFNFVMRNTNPDTYYEQRQPREDHGGSADGSDYHQPPLGEGGGQCYFEIIPDCVQLRK